MKLTANHAGHRDLVAIQASCSPGSLSLGR